MSEPTSETRVRVGIRIRPLTAKEINQGGKNSLQTSPPSIKVAERQFTFDTVFDSDVGQAELFDSVASPLLKAFVDGYNSTILAYGQTGTGKTFTMGSEAHNQAKKSTHTGLIPRFISEVFHEMQQKKELSAKAGERTPSLLEYRVSASFLEVYGEDVYDLLDRERKSLPLREDSVGGVVVTGLTQRSVSKPSETLDVLHEGTMNRTTAATLMNLTSSRSHAVFTIYLSQVVRPDKSNEVDISSTSRFTFVDLAGSERMKKTGAEGERAREGIKINEGLLALGNVINALADEERIARQRTVHVPYRQSKLTRLLQDALGGNSQTLFLACVSPSDTNVSETLSTLHYANRARNIKNAPTKNVDAAALELQRLQSLTHVLQCELIKSRFQEVESREENIGLIDHAMLCRPEVEKYLKSLHLVASDLSQRRASFSSGVSRYKAAIVKSLEPQVPSRCVSQELHTLDNNPNKTVLERFDESFLADVNPDEDMAILDHLLELQQQDHEYDTERRKDDERLKHMNGELEKGETLLLKIRDSCRAYHNLKRKYEELMGEVQRLESEKRTLSHQIEKVRTDPSIGCTAAIKKRLEKVEDSLTRARKETRIHRQKFKVADEQAKKCRSLERKISELKESKRVLMKKQKEDLLRYKATMDTKTKELLLLRRKDKTTGMKVSKLESEIQHHRSVLDRKRMYCTELSTKLKKTESHLLRLLTLRQRDLARNANQIGIRNGSSLFSLTKIGYQRQEKHLNKDDSMSREEWNSTRFVFNKLVWDKVDQAYLQNLYGERMAVYSDTLRKVMAKAKLLSATRRGQQKEGTTQDALVLEESVSDLEFRLELLGSELSDIRMKMPEETKRSVLDSDAAVSKIMDGMPNRVMRQMLLEAMSKLAEAETLRKTQAESLERKDAALLSFESEVENLTSRVTSLSNDLTERIRLVSNAGNDPYTLLSDLKKENMKLRERLQEKSDQLSKATSSAELFQQQMEESVLRQAKAEELVAYLKASSFQQGGMTESRGALDKLQKLWDELGVDLSFRKKESHEIQSSLADTCARKLSSAMDQKSNVEKSILLLSRYLGCMQQALGTTATLPPRSTTRKPLLKHLQKLQNEVDQLVTPYKYACARREKILNETIRLSEQMEISTSALPASLMVLLQQSEQETEMVDYDRTSNEHVDMDARVNTSALTPLTEIGQNGESGRCSFLLLPPQSLANAFLSDCEREIENLRVQKSELLLEHRETHQIIGDTVKDLNVGIEELLRNLRVSAENSEWGEKVDWQRIAIILSKTISFCPDFHLSAQDADQLRFIHESLAGLAKYRRMLSMELQCIVQRAQTTLLDIVGKEVDATEAYATFHETLFRLPSLSQDLILACISEMEALVLGLDAMAQSETEALSVVWEALDFCPSDRHDFWARVERELATENSINPFATIESNFGTSCESWLVEANRTATAVYEELHQKLRKLEMIHAEVELLRPKQDSKSRILSLDSELRILLSKLADLGQPESGNQRGLSQNVSVASVTLKQERLRNQIKSRLDSQAQQLSHLLKVWEDLEHTSFDSSLLSDGVRGFLDCTCEAASPIHGRSLTARASTMQATCRQEKTGSHESSSNCRKWKEQSDHLSDRERTSLLGARPICKKDSSIPPCDALRNVKRAREESFSSNFPATWRDRGRRKARRDERTLPRPFGRILSEACSPTSTDKENEDD